MPTAYVKAQAKKKGVSVARSEKQWDKAKADAKGGDWALVTHIYKNRMKHLDKRAEMYVRELAVQFNRQIEKLAASACEEELKEAAEKGEIVDPDQCTPPPKKEKKVPLASLLVLAAIKLNPEVDALKDPVEQQVSKPEPISKTNYTLDKGQTNSGKVGDRFNENLILANSENVSDDAKLGALLKIALAPGLKDSAESDPRLSYGYGSVGTGRTDSEQNVVDIGGQDTPWDFGYSDRTPGYGKNSDGDPNKRMHMMSNGNVYPGANGTNAFIA